MVCQSSLTGCNCPTTITNAFYCDCMSTQYYDSTLGCGITFNTHLNFLLLLWNSLSKVIRKNYGETCSPYGVCMCKTGLGLVCTSSVCSCATGYYWNNVQCGNLRK